MRFALFAAILLIAGCADQASGRYAHENHNRHTMELKNNGYFYFDGHLIGEWSEKGGVVTIQERNPGDLFALGLSDAYEVNAQGLRNVRGPIFPSLRRID